MGGQSKERRKSMSKILLLEDDISLVDGLKYSLKKNGFDVEVARNVCEAIKYLAEISKYDLLILDVTLPDEPSFRKTWWSEHDDNFFVVEYEII